jgi:tRNA(Arg) A34 adenosine deaminase TadA
MTAPAAEVRISLPSWAGELAARRDVYPAEEDRMRLAIELSRENVVRKAGGPFGAAVFERTSGRVVAVGVNSVVRLASSSLHGEVVALMMAQHRLGSYTLGAADRPEHELVTSCEPCAMCLGAILWSGVTRVVCGAAREDATRLAFEEGPVFPESYQYLERLGVTFARSVLRDEARAVLELYRATGGEVYNG